MTEELLSAMLPSDLLACFDITGFREEQDEELDRKILVIDLTEKNIIRIDGCSFEDYETKDFYPAKRVQDFPLRGKAVFLSINRRRWRHKKHKNKVVYNDYSFIAEGSKLTKELSDFLKHTGFDPGRHR